MNSLGKRLVLTSFGESHGPAMGGVLDGFPPGFKVDFEELQRFVDRRRPGASSDVSARREADKPEFLSGLSPEGVTLGSPLAFVIRNLDTRSSDYAAMQEAFRPNHADYTYRARYGIHDVRGGGRASARDTVSRVVAGALALQWLRTKGVEVSARLENEEATRAAAIAARAEADSVGGIVEGCISGLPRGLGDPVFGKFQADLAVAMLSINASMGFEFGRGFSAALMRGSEMADCMRPRLSRQDAGKPMASFSKVDRDLPQPEFMSNNCGGLNGGITNGEPVCFRVAFKPTPSIPRELATIGPDGKARRLSVHGRHDPCVALRAVPVVEAVAALVAADAILSDPRCNY